MSGMCTRTQKKLVPGSESGGLFGLLGGFLSTEQSKHVEVVQKCVCMFVLML